MPKLHQAHRNLRWLKAWHFAVLTILIAISAGYISMWLLLAVWLATGMASLIYCINWGHWNNGDSDSEQTFLAMMFLVFAPFGVYMAAEDILDESFR